MCYVACVYGNIFDHLKKGVVYLPRNAENILNNYWTCSSEMGKTMKQLSTILIILIAICSSSIASAEQSEEISTHKYVPVPLDHNAVDDQTLKLRVEFANGWNPSKPTVFIIADGQQFFIRENRFKESAYSRLNDDFNLVGIVGRHFNKQIHSAISNTDGSPNWEMIWKLGNSEQWVEDIEHVRKELLGKEGKVMLYGGSGGGLLIHQYLAKYGNHVSRAFTYSPVPSDIAANLGLNPDRFWPEFASENPALASKLQSYLVSNPEKRAKISFAFQRQNFFENIDDLATARATLAESIIQKNEQAFEASLEAYQVGPIMGLNSSPIGWMLAARMAELWMPHMWRLEAADTFPLNPDLEVAKYFIEPLQELFATGKISRTQFNTKGMHSVQAEVFVMAGQADHVVDYRAAIALANSYPNSTLFLARDGHMFQNLKDANTFKPLAIAFLRDGPHSAAYNTALQNTEAFRWRE